MNTIMKAIQLHYYLLLSLLLVMLTSSCVSSKKILYFQDADGVTMQDSIQNFEPTFQVGDVLKIHISAIDTEAARPFNLYQGKQTYLTSIDGTVNIPVLGNINVLGLTNKQLTELLTQRLSDYITKPIVNVRLVNFKVSVLGEVRNPGTYAVTNERISILEAISLAEDLTIQGERSTVTLIREQAGKRSMVNIDLTSKALFNSPYFYLKQNDVLYVAPNKSKINSSAIGPNTGVFVTLLSALISIIAILTR
jgi:polysaccharide export outer membrane protein